MLYCGILSADTVDSTTADTLISNTPDSKLVSDTLPHPHQAAETAEKKEKMNLVKRKFDSKQQVFLGVGMMVFIAVIMTTAQSWNPRN